MSRTIVKLTLIAGLVVAAALPAGATHDGDAGHYYVARAGTMRGAEVSGIAQTFSGPLSFDLSIMLLEGSAAEGPIRVLPLPTAQNVYPEDVPRVIGCMTIDAGSRGKDKGCTITSYQLEMDPALSSASLIVTWASDKFEGEDLRATILLASDGTPSPLTESKDPIIAPDAISIDQRLGVARTGSAVGGIVVSEGLGDFGAGAVANTDAARMFTGVYVDMEGAPECAVNVAAAGGCLPE